MGKMIFHRKGNRKYLYFNGKNYEIRISKNTQFELSDDIPFNELSHLTGYNLPRNFLITCDGEGQGCYPNLEYIHFFRKNDKLVITVDTNYKLTEWNEKINLLSFIEEFRERLSDIYSIESKQTNLFEESLVNVRFKIIVDCDMNLSSAVESLDKILLNEHKSLLSYNTVKYKISLSSRHQQAGKSLLHYLHRVMKYKKLSDDLTMSVMENNYLVSVSLRFPEKRKQEVLNAVYCYGMILKGELSTHDLLPYKAHRHQLNVSLDAVQRRIEFQNKKIYRKKMMFVSSEEEANWLKLQVGNCLTGESSELETHALG